MGMEATMLAIINGQVWTMTGTNFPKGTILIKDGKIVKVGDKIEIPSEAEVIDASGKIIMPGFIDAHCHVGILEEVYQIEGDDVNEATEAVTPHLRAMDAINPEDEGFKDAVAGGVTTVIISPGSANVIGGEMVAVKTAGKVIDKMIIKEPVGLKVAFGENPKRVHGGQKRMPATRMGTAGILREQLNKAKGYLEKFKQDDPTKYPEIDIRMDSIVRVLKKEIPLRAHAHRADDIMTAIRIAREFDLKLIIEHCTEGHKIVEEIIESGASVVVGPSIVNRAKVELRDKTLQTPGILAKAGANVALMTDHPVVPIHLFSLCAALSVKEGMAEEDALKAITINGAKIAGIDQRVGSLEEGKDADLIILDGHPFEIKTRVLSVYINGQNVFEHV